jgi:hypothetical protein
VEQPPLAGTNRELGEPTPNPRHVELVEPDAGIEHRGRQRVELDLGAEIDLPRLDEKDDVVFSLQAPPRLESVEGEMHVSRVVVGDPDRARRAGRGRNRVAAAPAVDADHGVPPASERPSSGESDHPQADPDDIGVLLVRHGRSLPSQVPRR